MHHHTGRYKYLVMILVCRSEAYIFYYINIYDQSFKFVSEIRKGITIYIFKINHHLNEQ